MTQQTETISSPLQLLTTREVAQRFRCTEAALRRMRAEHRGPKWVRVGRLIRYRVEDLNHYLDGCANRTDEGLQ